MVIQKKCVLILIAFFPMTAGAVLGDDSFLIDAFIKKNSKFVHLLLQRGTYVDTCDSEGSTALHLATIQRNFKMIRCLIHFKDNLNPRSNLGAIPLINRRNGLGLTALNIAALFGYDELVEYFLQQGADTSISDQYGETPLHWAAKKGFEHTVELLLSYHADSNVKDKMGKTPLDYACKYVENDAKKQQQPPKNLMLMITL